MHLQKVFSAVSVKRRLQTADCGPGVKCRLSVKCRLQTESKTQAGVKCRMKTVDFLNDVRRRRRSREERNGFVKEAYVVKYQGQVSVCLRVFAGFFCP